MTPTKSSYTTDRAKTGYTESQTINPQELDLWRVISINGAGTVDVISEDVSSTEVYFQGLIGYQNLVGYLNVLASQYENSKYTKGSRHFGYNDKYISHMFREIGGVTLKQFILQKKAEEASFFLTDTNLSVEEIAFRLGYSDSHNFTRSYKRDTGFSPTAYRNAFSKRVLNH